MTTGNERPIRLRVARCTEDLRRLACFYETVIGLSVSSRFRDHDGFSGEIYRVHNDLEWELIVGPSNTAPAPTRSARLLADESDPGGDGAAAADPDGFAVPVLASTRSRGGRQWTFERPTSSEAATRALYEGALRLTVVTTYDRTVDYGITSHRTLIRARTANVAVPPDVEDLLVVTYDNEPARYGAALRALKIGAETVQPHNPWWHRRALQHHPVPCHVDVGETLQSAAD